MLVICIISCQLLSKRCVSTVFEGVSTRYVWFQPQRLLQLQGELKTMSRGDLHENAARHGFITLTIRWGLRVFLFCACLGAFSAAALRRNTW